MTNFEYEIYTGDEYENGRKENFEHESEKQESFERMGRKERGCERGEFERDEREC